MLELKYGRHHPTDVGKKKNYPLYENCNILILRDVTIHWTHDTMCQTNKLHYSSTTVYIYLTLTFTHTQRN